MLFGLEITALGYNLNKETFAFTSIHFPFQGLGAVQSNIACVYICICSHNVVLEPDDHILLQIYYKQGIQYTHLPICILFTQSKGSPAIANCFVALFQPPQEFYVDCKGFPFQVSRKRGHWGLTERRWAEKQARLEVLERRFADKRELNWAFTHSREDNPAASAKPCGPMLCCISQTTMA